MSSKIEVSRELLESLVVGCGPTKFDMAAQEVRALLAAPVVERQPSSINENVEFEKWWCRTPVLRKGKLQMAQEAWEARAALSAPPELAKLQATIARLTTEIERNKKNAKSWKESSLYWMAEHDKLKFEIERLKAGQGEPVALTVWEGAMPESNGKSNFTVILHTGDLTEGICVYRSEYPDRARYEADCFRHLIGDLAFPEKPFICDYDADKHSGYVKPDASQPAPVAVVLPDGYMIVERSIWTEEQVESATKCITMLKNVPGMTDRDLALATMDAGQCKAPEITLSDFGKVKELNQ